MKIALDPYMIRHLSLPELCRATAELGYDQIELSPRSDFLDWWVMPRATKERMAGFKSAMKAAGVGLATLQPMYRWASPFEDERQWAVRCWKRAIEVAVEMGCDTLISEFGRGASPERSVGERPGANTKELCEAAWFRSMDELLPIFEREGLTLSVEPHPEHSAEGDLPPGVKVFELFGSLFFGAVGKIEALPAQLPAGTRCLVLEMHRLISIDTSGIDAMQQLHRTLQRRGVALVLALLSLAGGLLLIRFPLVRWLGTSCSGNSWLLRWVRLRRP